ncbi:MAG: ABC transporter ATP-binding protein [Armatimonadota bacterium]|nr:ABC transporter ATP-binding protein [Armatimonadota bacterium]
MADEYIVLRNVTRTYRRSDSELAALEDVSLSIPEGQFVGIVGHSGAGKSTLLNIIGGLDRPSRGSVTVGGTDLGSLDEAGLAVYRRETVGFVFQDANLVPALTVFENVMLPLVPLPGGEAEKTRRVEDALEEVNIGHRASHLPGELSGGEQQRTAVARAVVNDPQIILADEPTGELDSENAGRILTLLGRLNEQGRTVIIASHDRDTIAVTRRIFRLQDGALVSDDAQSGQPRLEQHATGSAER